MATAKFTVAQGGSAPKVTKAGGATISGGNALEVNVDTTKVSSADFVAMLEDVKAAALTTGWPPA